MSNTTSSASHLEITGIYQNVRGLNTKTASFYKSICSTNYDFIAVTESRVQDNIFSSELFDNRYSVFRCNRNLDGMGVSRGGGAILAVNNKFRAVQVDFQAIRNNVMEVDIVGCKVSINFLTVLVIVIYIPPKTTLQDRATFFEYLESLRILHGNNLLIVGDFNLPNRHDTTDKDTVIEMFNNFINLLSLQQLNYIDNAYGNRLDLVLSNKKCVVSKEHIPLVKKDDYHPALNNSLSLFSSRKTELQVNTAQFRYNFRKADFPLLYDMILHIDWSDLFSLHDVNEVCARFYGKLYDLFEVCVPRSVIRKRSYPIWFTTEVIRLIKRKHRIFKKLKKHFSLKLQDEFRQIRARIKRNIDIAYKNYSTKVENSISTDPRSFWSFINAKKSSRELPAVVSDGNSQYSDPESIVNAFADFFRSVYTSPSNQTFPETIGNSNSPISLEYLSEELILKALKKSKNKQTVGPDKVPCFVVKDCAFALVKPLSFIFNLALKSGTFPDVWKEARITPVFKKGNPNEVSNYRPVSILSPFAKVFEMSVYDCLFSQIKQLISPMQHGFFSNRSTISNLACFTQFTAKALDSRKQIDTAYTDFSKAFDRVDHYILLHKLSRLGFSENLTLFFESYLKERQQYVEIRGHRSFKFTATSGAPQGSNLAPLIFSIFINDISDNISSNVLLFADDLKIFREVNDYTDCVILQDDLNALADWCNTNNLPLNVDKCFSMTFTNKQEILYFNYSLSNTVIKRSDTFKDLGVTFDPKLSFASHISNTCSSAIKMLGYIMRNTSDFVNEKTLKTLYYSFVRSKLEYGSVIWNPIHNKYVTQLENVQRKFVKYLAYRVDGVYPHRGVEQNDLLNRFQIPLLQKRRRYLLTHFLFKVCRSLIDCPDLLTQIGFHVPTRAVRSPPVFHLPTPSTNFLIIAPLFQSMSEYNKTCNDIDVYGLSVAQFLKALKFRYLQNQ